MFQRSRSPATGGDRPSDTTLQDVWGAIFRHKGKAVLFFMAVMVVVALGTVFWPKKYRSEGKFLVRLGRENVKLDPTTMASPETIMAIPQSRENEINSVAEVLRSRVLVEKVVDSLGPAKVLGSDEEPTGCSAPACPRAAEAGTPGTLLQATWLEWVSWLKQFNPVVPLGARDRAILKLTKELEANAIRKTNLVAISYDGYSPELAQAVVAKLMDFYLQEHIRLNRSLGAHQFLADETSRLHGELAREEEQLRDLKQQTGLASPEGRLQVIVKRVGQLEDDLLRNDAATVAAQARVRGLEETLAALPEKEVIGQTAGYPNEGTDAMRAQLYALQLREQQAAARYAESHPLLQEAHRQRASAEEILSQEERTRNQVTTARGRPFEQALLGLLNEKPALAALKAESETVQRQLADASQALKAFDDNNLRIVSLQREIQLLEANYRRYATNLEQARIDQALESQRISNISVAQPATYEVKPVSPRVMQNLIVGLIMGLFGGLGLAVSAEYLDRSFRTPEDIERKLELPALASIPELKRKQLVLHGKS